jgi:hypothetical protein
MHNLQPIYVRGLALLEQGRGKQAATEFQKIIDHPGIVMTCVQGALAHVQLGRAQAMVPIYQQAKAEYARLK